MGIKAKTFLIKQGSGLDEVEAFFLSEIGRDGYLISGLDAATLNERVVQLTILYRDYPIKPIEAVSPREGGLFQTGIDLTHAQVLFSNPIDPRSIQTGTVIIDGRELDTGDIHVDTGSNNYIAHIRLSGDPNTSGHHEIRVDSAKIQRQNGTSFDYGPVFGYTMHYQSVAYPGDPPNGEFEKRRGKLAISRVPITRNSNPQKAVSEFLTSQGLSDNRLITYATTSLGTNRIDVYVIYYATLDPHVVDWFPHTNTLTPEVNAPENVTFVFSEKIDSGQVTNAPGIFTLTTDYKHDRDIAVGLLSVLDDGRTVRVDTSSLFSGKRQNYNIVIRPKLRNAEGTATLERPILWSMMSDRYSGLSASGAAGVGGAADGSGAPPEAQYLMATGHSLLSNEKVLEFGSGMSGEIVGNTLTVSGFLATDTRPGLASFNNQFNLTLKGHASINEANVDHDSLLNFEAGEHFTEASIDHNNIQNVGTKSHTTLETALDNLYTWSGTVAVITGQFGEHTGDATNVHGIGSTSSVVGTLTTQTLENKTLDTPAIANFSSATHSHENAAGGGQIDHTAALTNVGTKTHAQIDVGFSALDSWSGTVEASESYFGKVLTGLTGYSGELATWTGAVADVTGRITEALYVTMSNNSLLKFERHLASGIHTIVVDGGPAGPVSLTVHATGVMGAALQAGLEVGSLDVRNFLAYNQTQNLWKNFELQTNSGLGIDWSETDDTAVLHMTGGFSELSDMADRARKDSDIMMFANPEWGPFSLGALNGIETIFDTTAFNFTLSGYPASTTGHGVVWPTGSQFEITGEIMSLTGLGTGLKEFYLWDSNRDHKLKFVTEDNFSTNLTLNFPDNDGTDSVVYTGRSQSLGGKTLLTPTIADFSLANHTHNSDAAGGTLDHLDALANVGETTHAKIDQILTGLTGMSGEFVSHTGDAGVHGIGASSEVVGTLTSQLLRNKTISILKLADLTETDNLVLSVPEQTNSRTISFPVFSRADTFVFTGIEQTLGGKTLLSPTVADFSNATHDHSDAGGGGPLVVASTSISGASQYTTGQFKVDHGKVSLTGIPIALSGTIITRQFIGNSNSEVTQLNVKRGGNQPLTEANIVGALPREVHLGRVSTTADHNAAGAKHWGLDLYLNNDVNPSATKYYKMGGANSWWTTVGEWDVGAGLVIGTGNYIRLDTTGEATLNPDVDIVIEFICNGN